MTNKSKSRADTILEKLNSPLNEVLTSADLRSRYGRLPDHLKKPAQLAHIIAIIGAIVDQLAQVPADFMKTNDTRW